MLNVFNQMAKTRLDTCTHSYLVSRKNSTSQVDDLICAEIPDPETDSDPHDIVITNGVWRH